ncbi:MAG: hypothetical protein NVSMB22_27270 [Chloroflexota bacterium]
MTVTTQASITTRTTVSVVVVTRDRPALLASLLQALNAQRPPLHEVVVVDGGPSPETRVAAEAAGALYVPAPRSSLGAARQTGVDVSSGSVLAFTDDDCLPEAGWSAALVGALDAEPTLVGVQGATVQERGPIGSHGIRVSRPNRLYQTCNMAYRRDALLRAGGFDETFCRYFEDTAVAARVLRLGPIGWEPRARVIHRAMPRRLFTREDWLQVLADEYRLSRTYPDFYHAYRGTSFATSVVIHWMAGSAVKTLVKNLPMALQTPMLYARLLSQVLVERWNLMCALRDFVPGRSDS